ncbi:hypothetical protein NDA16_002217 [Ustilago loliicola]|nr:hypothetical protein NDA16_002217 [Ustilago loliicola]
MALRFSVDVNHDGENECGGPPHTSLPPGLVNRSLVSEPTDDEQHWAMPTALAAMDAELEQVEQAVAQYDVPAYFPHTLRNAKTAYEHFVEYLCHRELLQDGVPSPTQQQIERIKVSVIASLEERVNNRDAWVAYLHLYAISGRGMATEETVEHTIVRVLD